MTVDIDTLRAEVRGSSANDEQLERSLKLATSLVATYLADNEAVGDAAPPTAVTDQAVLAVAVEAFNQSQAPNGVLNQQFDNPEGGLSTVPVRISADPMRPAYPLLGMYVLPVVGG